MSLPTNTDFDIENKGFRVGLNTAINDVENNCVSDNLEFLTNLQFINGFMRAYYEYVMINKDKNKNKNDDKNDDEDKNEDKNEEPLQKKSRHTFHNDSSSSSSSFETPLPIPVPTVHLMRANPFTRPNPFTHQNCFVFGATQPKPTMNPNFNDTRSMQFNPKNPFPEMNPNSDQQSEPLITPHKPILTFDLSPVQQSKTKKTRSKKE